MPRLSGPHPANAGTTEPFPELGGIKQLRALPTACAAPAFGAWDILSGTSSPPDPSLLCTHPSIPRKENGPGASALSLGLYLVTTHHPTEGDGGCGVWSCQATAAQLRMVTSRALAICPHDPCPAVRWHPSPQLPPAPTEDVTSHPVCPGGERSCSRSPGRPGGWGGGGWGTTHDTTRGTLTDLGQAGHQDPGGHQAGRLHLPPLPPQQLGSRRGGGAEGGRRGLHGPAPLPAAPPRSRPPPASRARGAAPVRPHPTCSARRSPPRSAFPPAPRLRYCPGVSCTAPGPPAPAPGPGTALLTPCIPLHPSSPAPSRCSLPQRGPPGITLVPPARPPAPASVPPAPQQPPCLYPGATLAPFPWLLPGGAPCVTLVLHALPWCPFSAQVPSPWLRPPSPTRFPVSPPNLPPPPPQPSPFCCQPRASIPTPAAA